MVPVTTMEEVPVLGADERDDLLGKLEEAKDEVRAGKAVDYDPKAFKRRLLDRYLAHKKAR